MRVVRHLVKGELALWRNPVQWAAAVIVAALPALYCIIVLCSFSDPYGRLDQLPVGLVNLDAGTTFRGTDYRLGAELVKTLEREKTVRAVLYADEESARAAVRSGDLYFSLTLPESFSADALSGESARRARVRLYVSEGGNYMASKISRSAASTIGQTVNATLSRARWDAVLSSLGQVRSGFGGIKDAAGKLLAGAQTLGSGSAQIAGGTRSLSEGLATAAGGGSQLAAGTRTLSTTIGQLCEGIMQLSDGLRQLDAAAPGQEELAVLKDGVAQLDQGATQLAQKVNASILLPGQLKSGTATLAKGETQLRAGVETLIQGNVKIKAALDAIVAKLPASSDMAALWKGAETLADKTGQLAVGLARLNGGAATLAQGASALASGAAQLAGGLAMVNEKVPSSVTGLGGDAEGLAESVRVTVETTASVANNGTAFAPYFMSLSLWVGVLMISFILPFRKVPENARGAGQLRLLLSKMAVPLLLVAIQAVSATLCVHAIGFVFTNFWLTLLTSLLAGMSFFMVVFTLMLFLGDAGKMLSVLLLMVQLASTGGTYPIELSPGFYRAICDWIPLTYSLKGFRFAITGAYEGHYGAFMLRLCAFGVACFSLCLLGRAGWRYVGDDVYGKGMIEA